MMYFNILSFEEFENLGCLWSQVELFLTFVNSFLKNCHQELRLFEVLHLPLSLNLINKKKIVSLLYENFYVFKFVFMLVGQRNYIVFLFVCLFFVFYFLFFYSTVTCKFTFSVYIFETIKFRNKKNCMTIDHF